MRGADCWTDHCLIHSQLSMRVCPPEVSMDRIRIGYPEGYLRYFRIRIGFGYSFLKNIGSRQEQDICLISITKFS